mgnify:CR=1 FL=1
MSFSRRRTTAAIAATTALFTLSACGGSSPDNAPAADGSATPATLMLNWYPYGEHAPFYYGVQEGIFADHGIDLTSIMRAMVVNIPYRPVIFPRKGKSINQGLST